MEGFMTTKEAAEKWNISVRQVQNHCKNGRIKGVIRVGTNYLIPKDAVKPTYAYIYEASSGSQQWVRYIVQKFCYAHDVEVYVKHIIVWRKIYGSKQPIQV